MSFPVRSGFSRRVVFPASLTVLLASFASTSVAQNSLLFRTAARSLPPIRTAELPKGEEPQPTVRVRTAVELLFELDPASAFEGKRIYVEDAAVIDLAAGLREYHGVDEVTEDHLPIYIPGGVTLAGGRRSNRPGALLYYPEKFPESRNSESLFSIRRDNVRITGLRIRGPDQGVTEGDDKNDVPTGITIDVRGELQVGVEIDHCDLFGWSLAAIRVFDRDDLVRYGKMEDGRLTVDHRSPPTLVHIHDNFIHHNQHWGWAGYGVLIKASAFALIERNVFDYNRHAIATSGDAGGYLAYENLVLKNGGIHKCYAGVCFHTHQFDVHGSENSFPCPHGSCWDGGRAGEYIDVRRNSFLYTADNAVKLRGTPEIRMDVIDNVFAHSRPDAAVEQTEEGLQTRNNTYGVDGSRSYGVGDFDGDGRDDLFLATGRTWWYFGDYRRPNDGSQHWSYLNNSDKLRGDLSFGKYDGDDLTDVATRSGDQWLISSGGRGSWEPYGTERRQLGRGWVHFSVGTGFEYASQPDTSVGFYDSEHWLRGDFNGDGRDDLVDVYGRDGTAEAWLHLRTVLPNGLEAFEYQSSLDAFAGFSGSQRWLAGDFDGDGMDDLVNVYGRRGVARAWVHLSTGSGFEYQSSFTGLAGFSDSQRWLAGDFNGDGMDDLANVYEDDGRARAWVHLSTGSGFEYQSSLNTFAGFSESQRWLAGDFNGDGRDDLVNVYGNRGVARAWVHLSTGSGFQYQSSFTPFAGFWATQRWLVGDFNRDGLDDLVNVYGSAEARAWTHFSTGFGFQHRSSFDVLTTFTEGHPWLTGDFNGDGMDDLLVRGLRPVVQ